MYLNNLAVMTIFDQDVNKSGRLTSEAFQCLLRADIAIFDRYVVKNRFGPSANLTFKQMMSLRRRRRK